jgi:catechol 2,3-dioxygenase-like lactoylglutathione lyase family enzyme
MSSSKIVSKHTPLYHLGFYVPDARAFAQAHHELYGSGPYIVLENNDSYTYFHGEKVTTNMTICTGWWKDISVEVIQQNSDNESYLTENGRYGFHHICFGVSDVEAAVKEFAEYGVPVQMYNYDMPEFPFAYVDARETSGYYIELNPQMDFMSQVVKGWAVDWDGESNLFRSMADVDMSQMGQ